MFFYLYDSFVLDKSYTNTLNRIESRIIELGINGRVEKLTPLRNMKELLEQGMADDAHTIVAVGNDTTLIRVLNIVASHNVVVGYIPVQTDTPISKLCGIPDAFEACNILSRRIIKTLPLLKVNQNYVLSTLTAKLPTDATIRCNDAFTLKPTTPDTSLTVSIESQFCKLELQPQPPAAGWLSFGAKKTLFPTSCSAHKIVVDCPESSVPVLLDETITIKTPVTIQLKPKALKLIVGKGRLI